MSADNYLVIFKDDDGKYRAYMGFASDETSYEDLRKHTLQFEADTIEGAIALAQKDYYEYGYEFVGVGDAAPK